MRLEHICIEQLRNISSESIKLHPQVNIFIGRNGSGKTSLLEAIHFLAFARSFRARSPAQMIQHQANFCRVVAKLAPETSLSAIKHGSVVTLGIEKNIDNATVLRLQGERLNSITEVARVFPLQLLNAQTYQLLQAAPVERRKLLNWAVFHVKHPFADLWKQFSRSLKQRNALLRQGTSRSELAFWDREYLLLSEQLFSMQEQVFLMWQQRFLAMSKPFFTLPLELKFKTGVPQGKELAVCLPAAYERESILGYTRYGPHRSDVALMVDKTPARYFLSLGQQKIAAILMSCSLIQVVSEHLGQAVHYLVDDLAADLDQSVVKQVVSLLLEQQTQLFLTCTELELLMPGIEIPSCKMFHVKHGHISPLTTMLNTVDAETPCFT